MSDEVVANSTTGHRWAWIFGAIILACARARKHTAAGGYESGQGPRELSQVGDCGRALVSRDPGNDEEGFG
jgi:hypothetical protein